MKPLAELRIAFGADHAAFQLKAHLMQQLQGRVAAIQDFGCYSEESVDYPDFAKPVCEAILKGEADYGILLCGSGVGISIAANKFPGIRAGLAWTTDIAELVRSHNNAQILCMGARFIAPYLATKMMEKFLTTDFEEGNHVRRLAKLESNPASFC